MIYGVAAAETLGCLEDGGEGVSIPSIHVYITEIILKTRAICCILMHIFLGIAPLTEISVDAHERMT